MYAYGKQLKSQPPSDRNTSTPAATSVLMLPCSAAKPSSPEADRLRPLVASVAEPGRYTMVGVTKDTKSRVMGSVAAELARRDIFARPCGPLMRT